MRGAVRSLPNTPSWRGAQLKHRDNFTFPFTFTFTFTYYITPWAELSTLEIGMTLEVQDDVY
jgi:hypothetical protein